MAPDTANPEGLARCGSFGKSATAFVGADAFADSADSLVGAACFPRNSRIVRSVHRRLAAARHARGENSPA